MPSHNHFSMPSQQHSFHGPPQIAQSHTQPSQHRMVAVSNSKNSERNAFQSQSHHSAPHFGGHSKSNSVQMHSQNDHGNKPFSMPRMPSSPSPSNVGFVPPSPGREVQKYQSYQNKRQQRDEERKERERVRREEEEKERARMVPSVRVHNKLAAPLNNARYSDTVLKSGYGEKQGGSWKSWKKRWFVLRINGRLSYFEDAKSKKVISTIDCNTASCVKMESFGKSKEFGIVMCTPKRDWKFAWQSSQERKEWFQKLNGIILIKN